MRRIGKKKGIWTLGILSLILITVAIAISNILTSRDDTSIHTSEASRVSRNSDSLLISLSDFDRNGIIDIRDFSKFMRLYREKRVEADLNKDGVIDLSDFILFKESYKERGVGQFITPIPEQQTCPKNMRCFHEKLYDSQISTWYVLWDWDQIQGHIASDLAGKFNYKGWGMSLFRPTLGYYRGDNSEVWGSHIRLLDEAGVDVIIVDATNGLGAVKTNEYAIKFQDYLETTQSPLKLAIAIGACTWAGEKTQTQRLACQTSESNYVYNRHARRSSYFKLFHKPLLINYTTDIDGNHATGDVQSWNNDPYLNWDDSRYFVGLANGLVSAFPGIKFKAERGMWGWVNDQQQNHPIVVSISPGWHRSTTNDQITSPIRRFNGETLSKAFLQAIKTNPEVINVGSFNDFFEGQWWEPALLDETKPLVQNWQPYYVEPSADAMKTKDPYNTEVADWYYQIVKGYSLLRYGLIDNYCYREEGNQDVYCLVDKELKYIGAMPANKPVILVPENTFSKLQ
jgi:hypothetical protein